MGTVHGVYLKYVGMSILSYAGYASIMKDPVTGNRLTFWNDIVLQLFSQTRHLGTTDRSMFLSGSSIGHNGVSTIRTVAAFVLGYSVLLNGLIAVLFKLERGMSILGKDRKTGQIPFWSKILFFPFHIPTILYTHIHIRTHAKTVPVATEVQPGWWVGSCYGHELNKQWAGVIDLTTEFPETTINTTRSYLSIPTWDGVPATPEQLEIAANFAVTAYENGGDVLVHCAHGRGRSTTVMCACLVKVGLYKTWQEAFDHGIKPARPVCKLNTLMKQALTQWQAIYVDGTIDLKKGQ